jgi:hypothetical protein
LTTGLINLACTYRGGKDIRFEVDGEGNVREKGELVGSLEARENGAGSIEYRTHHHGTARDSGWCSVHDFALAWLADRVRETRYGMQP